MFSKLDEDLGQRKLITLPIGDFLQIKACSYLKFVSGPNAFLCYASQKITVVKNKTRPQEFYALKVHTSA